MRCEHTLKDKEKEVEQAKSDLLGVQELMKEQILLVKGKEKQIASLEGQIKSLNGLIQEKTEANLTMGEVIERVKQELTQEYEPLILQLKEENRAKDVFYQRESEKEHINFQEKHYSLLQQLKEQERIQAEWREKLEHKGLECAQYQRQSEEKRLQYSDLLSRKEEMELNKNNIIDDLEKILQGKELQIKDYQIEISVL